MSYLTIPASRRLAVVATRFLLDISIQHKPVIVAIDYPTGHLQSTITPALTILATTMPALFVWTVIAAVSSRQTGQISLTNPFAPAVMPGYTEPFLPATLVQRKIIRHVVTRAVIMSEIGFGKMV